jgi:arabinose-5-phosphate isomerase
MAKPKPAQVTSDRAQAAIASALRTLEAEGSGVDALAAALRDGLGTMFAAAIDVIRAAQGRVIVTGMGKSGHVARKIARHSHPPVRRRFVHLAKPAGDLGMIANNDVIWRCGLVKRRNSKTSLIIRVNYGIKLIAMTAIVVSTVAKVADVVLALPQAREACPHNLAPTTSSLMQRARRRFGYRALKATASTPVSSAFCIPAANSGTLLKTVRDIMHTGTTIAAVATRHARMARGNPRNDHQGLRLCQHNRRAWTFWLESSPTAICGDMREKFARRVDDVMTWAQDRAARSAA